MHLISFWHSKEIKLHAKENMQIVLRMILKCYEEQKQSEFWSKLAFWKKVRHVTFKKLHSNCTFVTPIQSLEAKTFFFKFGSGHDQENELQTRNKKRTWNKLVQSSWCKIRKRDRTKNWNSRKDNSSRTVGSLQVRTSIRLNRKSTTLGFITSELDSGSFFTPIYLIAFPIRNCTLNYWKI